MIPAVYFTASKVEEASRRASAITFMLLQREAVLAGDDPKMVPETSKVSPCTTQASNDPLAQIACAMTGSRCSSRAVVVPRTNPPSGALLRFDGSSPIRTGRARCGSAMSYRASHPNAVGRRR